MSTTWNWNGARWWKFDFHTHTPKSDDYGKGHNQATFKARATKDWVLDYMRAGLDCVAITDHNSGDWIDEVKNAEAELAKENHAEYRKLVIFPGVEISVNGGIHVLAIFDPTKGSQDVVRLLGACDYHGTSGKSDAVTEKSFTQVVDEIVKQGGIAIPAHADDKDSGLFKLKGQTLQQALSCEQVFALELVDKNGVKLDAYTGKNLSWTEVVGSDAHHPSGTKGQKYPGSRFTWVKMGTPGIEGLRLALLDGPLSVLRSDATTMNPNDHAGMVIESIEISQARYIGRPNPYVLRLNPWMNAFIGGRGTGKSTIVEFLRLALRREDELPSPLKDDFEKYKTVYADRDETGLLTSDATIRVVYRKDGASYRVQWSPSGTLDPIEQWTDQRWSRAEGDIRQRFPVRMYSQKQVFQLASTPLALLNIINDAPEVDYMSWQKRLNTEETQYLSLRAKIREIESGLAEESRLKGELEDIKRKLAIFEQSGHAETLKMLQKRRRQLQAVESWETPLNGAGDLLRDWAEQISPETLDESAFDKSIQEDARLLEATQKASDATGKIAGQIKELAKQADTVLADWRQKKDASEWKASVDVAIRAYETLLAKLTQECVADPAGYGVLVQRRQVIEKQLGELEDRKKQVVKLKTQADTTLERVAALRREITATRGDFLRKVLKDNCYVQIAIAPYGAKETVEDEFRRLIQRDSGGFEKDLGAPDEDGLLSGIYKDGPAVANVEKNLSALKRKLREIERNSKQVHVSDKRFATHIAGLPPEALDRLDLWFPEDSLNVEYSPSTDRQAFRPIHEGSPGQKTAALLAFLLSYGDEPLILDQPEDDLDNHLIYDLIVTQLREVKRRRQVLVVTHNANIVVNGDAEYVVALTTKGGQSQVEAEGCLQEMTVRDAICDVMEGGEKAFKQRYRRIVLEGRHD
jgi:energy-coupling factor transporter ATP-binding protein EcfA2/predicted metal-dependent phosphoesterase TrpH